MTGPTLEEINNLNAEELVKDIFRGWVFIRKTYTKEIQKFQFSEQTKADLRRMAQELYNKYADQQKLTQNKLKLDKGVLNIFYYIQIY
ncbi:MAG: hypothetical protein ACFFC7_26280 [Candidatus Hermodarchaeota archaeon]